MSKFANYNEFFISTNVKLANTGDKAAFSGTPTQAIVFSPDCITTDNSPVRIELYEDPTITTVGTAITPDETDFNLSNVSTTAVNGGVVMTADTGTLKCSTIVVGSKQTGGLKNDFVQFTLRPGHTYVYQITNLSSGAANVSTQMVWLEPKVRDNSLYQG